MGFHVHGGPQGLGHRPQAPSVALLHPGYTENALVASMRGMR
ncbi:hypothetical protein SHIRM173S_01900 [Streptomyces hirsutus]